MSAPISKGLTFTEDTPVNFVDNATNAKERSTHGAVTALNLSLLHESHMPSRNASDDCDGIYNVEECVDLKCLLLEDTTLECASRHLQLLLQQVEPSNQAEILFLLIYVVALECGYAAQNAFNECRDILDSVKETGFFHAKNVMCLSRHKPTYAKPNPKQYIMELCSTAGTSSLQFGAILSARVTGDFMIVTITPTPTNTLSTCGRSLCLSIERYVLADSYAGRNGRSPNQCLRKMAELSYTLRERFFVPICQQQQQQQQFEDENNDADEFLLPIYPSLSTLSVELYDHIFDYLNVKQLRTMASVNKALNRYSMECIRRRYRAALISH